MKSTPSLILILILLVLALFGIYKFSHKPVAVEPPTTVVSNIDDAAAHSVVTEFGTWECLPVKDPSQPHTLECAFGIAVDQSDAHYAVDTQFMPSQPVDFPTGAKVRVTGKVTPVEQLSSIQKYDIDGIISATSIEKI